jgi:lipoprotein-anchoring transpeptidase ErfK/SrfK
MPHLLRGIARLLAFVVLKLACGEALAADEVDQINRATFEGSGSNERARVVKMQVLLDRKHFSPGVIDGRTGENIKHALRAFEGQSGLPAGGKLDRQVWDLLNQGAGEVLTRYKILPEDVKGPCVEKIPKDFAEMARMQRLSYSGPVELLAEKFHMLADLLKALNPGARFEEGENIIVANVLDAQPKGEVNRIEVDTNEKVVRGYGRDGALLVVYPASIGSDANPSPSGQMKVKSIAVDPVYAYRPDENFAQPGNEEPLDLPPGPNGPVGSIWIDLSKETYGIHGTPEPELVGKRASHGCVRLTNWDAEELAHLVKPGAEVTFQD